MYTDIRTRQTDRQTDRQTHTRITLGHTKHVLLWIYGSEVDQEHCKRKQTHILPIPITSLTSCNSQLIYTTHTHKQAHIPHLRNDTLEQVRSLVGTSTHKESPITTSLNSQPAMNKSNTCTEHDSYPVCRVWLRLIQLVWFKKYHGSYNSIRLWSITTCICTIMSQRYIIMLLFRQVIMWHWQSYLLLIVLSSTQQRKLLHYLSYRIHKFFLGFAVYFHQCLSSQELNFFTHKPPSVSINWISTCNWT